MQKSCSRLGSELDAGFINPTEALPAPEDLSAWWQGLEINHTAQSLPRAECVGPEQTLQGPARPPWLAPDRGLPDQKSDWCLQACMGPASSLSDTLRARRSCLALSLSQQTPPDPGPRSSEAPQLPTSACAGL